MAPINVGQRWYAARRVALMVLGTAVEKLTVQAVEVLAIRWHHLQMLVPRRDRPLA